MRTALAALALWLAAVAPAAAGPIVCSGGETLAPLVRAWGQRLHQRAPAVSVVVDPKAKLAAEGFETLLAGQVDCAIFVREPFPRELAEYRARFHRDPLLVPVARGSFATRGGTHAIAIYVNQANPVRGLTLAQLRAAFTGEARTWGDLGLGGAWADRPIHVYGMLTARASGDPPGIVNFMNWRVLGGAAWRGDLVQLADRPGDQALTQIVRRAAEDPDALGYSGFGYAQPGARATSIAEAAKGTYVAGSAASLSDGTYPLARKVYILARPGKDDGLMVFLRFVLSAEGQSMIRSDPEGFLPLTAAEAAAARRLVR